MAIVDVCGVDDTDGEHDDIGIDEGILLVVYKYQILGLSSCKLPTI